VPKLPPAQIRRGAAKAGGPVPSPAVRKNDLAKLPAAGSNAILLKLPPAPPRRDQGKTDSPYPRPTVEEKNISKLPPAHSNDEEITMDRDAVLAVLVGKNDLADVSPSYIESIGTKEIIGKGCFGTVYKGTDMALNRSFAMKAIKTDILRGGHSAVVQKAKETFLMEIEVRRVALCPLLNSVCEHEGNIKLSNLIFLLATGIFAHSTS
jgi:hypothetical protein